MQIDNDIDAGIGVEIIEGRYSGFCYGVRKAVKQVCSEIEKNAASGKKIYLMGKLIHNDTFIGELLAKGLILIDNSAIEELNICAVEDIKLDGGGRWGKFRKKIEELGIEDDSIVILRAHGIPQGVYDALAGIRTEKKLKILDTACGDVRKIHKMAADNTSAETFTVILGDKNHPEVQGTKSYVRGTSAVCKDYGELTAQFPEIKKKIKIKNGDKKLIVLAQTTHNINDYNICKEFIKKEYTNALFFDTICSVTEQRQTEAERVSKVADIMIVVGEKNSSNTKKLYEICKANCANTFIIETSEQLPLYILQELSGKNSGNAKNAKRKGAVKVGITAGASTPDSIIKEVKRIMAENINEAVDSEMSFQEMLDSSNSFVILNRGSKVKGTISAISGSEIHVDLGAKHTGILTFDEITDDTSVKLEEMFKIGDEVETQVLKVNDAEGTALLSKKRIDSTENWEKIVKCHEDGTILDGKIVQVVNGGLIALAEAVKLFVPASHANVSFDTNLQTLLGKRLRMKIIDINAAKHRAIASVKEAYAEDRKTNAAKIWGEIEIGKRYDGVVKSIVNYGAFVDIGGVDGMVHRTELSWSRVKHPSEVLKIGDNIEVYIKDFDAEKRRISLGYRNEQNDPWIKFLTGYKVGDIVDVKILKMMPFGAFAEILPGVDGLIHNTQISIKRVSKPTELLTVGEIVKAKITDINEADRKLSLSIRAVLEESIASIGEQHGVTVETAPKSEAGEEPPQA